MGGCIVNATAILGALVAFTGCAAKFEVNQIIKKQGASVTKYGISGDSSVHWGYSGKTGPEYWKDMGFGECGLYRQSPIDLTNGIPKHFPPFNFQGYSQVPE